MRSLPRRALAPGLSLWVFSRDTLFCLYSEVSYPGPTRPLRHACLLVSEECDARTGEYRENGAGEDRDPLHDVRHFEEALVNPRSIDSPCSRFLRPFLGLADPIQAHVGIQ